MKIYFPFIILLGILLILSSCHSNKILTQCPDFKTYKNVTYKPKKKTRKISSKGSKKIQIAKKIPKLALLNKKPIQMRIRV